MITMRRFESLRDIKDSTRQSKPVVGSKKPQDAGLLHNADPECAERVFRRRDALAVEGSAATERMNRPGRLGTSGDDGGTAFKSGGAVKSGPGWLEGLRHRTPVQHNPSGKNDQQDVNRGRPVTY
jgi:hypothetical protein